MKSNVARRAAELSRYKFVCRWQFSRDFCVNVARKWYSEHGSPARRGTPSFRGTSLFVGGDTREGLVKINVARRAERSRYKFVCRWPCREGLVKSNVARRAAELSRYKFVCRWQFSRDFCVNVARKWRETSSLL